MLRAFARLTDFLERVDRALDRAWDDPLFWDDDAAWPESWPTAPVTTSGLADLS